MCPCPPHHAHCWFAEMPRLYKKRLQKKQLQQQEAEAEGGKENNRRAVWSF